MYFVNFDVKPSIALSLGIIEVFSHRSWYFGFKFRLFHLQDHKSEEHDIVCDHNAKWGADGRGIFHIEPHVCYAHK
jgi:hypothetical protein